MAGVFGGPLGAFATASGEAVDYLAAGPGSPNLKELVQRIAQELEGFAQGEGWPEDVVDRSALNVTEMLARNPPTASAIAGASFDPDALVGQIQAKSARLTETLDPPDAAACRLLLNRVVRAMASSRSTFPDVQHEFQRSVTLKLNDVEGLSQEIRQSIERLFAMTLLTNPASPWEPELYPSSALLRARYAIVPFFGRETELADLDRWSDSPSRIAVQLFSGPGGIGKSRLLMEACLRLQARGWRTGFLRADVQNITVDDLRRLGECADGIAIVVDYAETRRATVRQALAAAIESGVKSRFILLARHAGEWWGDLAYSPGAVGDLMNGPTVTHTRLGPVATTQGSRSVVFASAVAAFSRALNVHPRDSGEEDLASELFERILFVHAAALSRVVGEDADTECSLLDLLLRREQEFLDRALASAGLGHLAGSAIRQVAALVTLTGGAEGRSEAVRLIAKAPRLLGETPGNLMQVATMLRMYYPSDAWLGGVEPDLLGEHLVAAALQEDPTLLDVIGGV